MEELRSTEVLDKEIETDARKKAERILSKADLDGKSLLDNVAARVAALKAEKGADYEKKIEAFQKDEDASLPLEKARFLVSFTESAIIQGINEYFESLPEAKRLDMVLSRYKKYETIISSKKVNAYVFGFKAGDVKKALVKAGVNLASCAQVEYEKSGDDPVEGLTVKEGTILETEDKQILCRLTIAQIVSEINKEYRAELASTLLGGRLS
jgi:V/A-type H+/Na+-transporting ATPase subunit E